MPGDLRIAWTWLLVFTYRRPDHKKRPLLLKTNKPLDLLPYVLIPAGGVASFYLFQKHLQLASGQKRKSDFCSDMFDRGCDQALLADMSVILGLPLAGWGLLFYTTLLLFLALPKLLGTSFSIVSNRILFYVTLLGLLTALSLLTLMALQRDLFCPVCTFIHIVNIALFFSLPRLHGVSIRSCLSEPWNPHSFQKRNTGHGFKSFSWTSLGLASSMLLIGALFLSLQTISKSAAEEPTMIDAGPILKAFNAQSALNIPRSPGSPSLGSTTSPVDVVIFSDFYCAGCRSVSTEIANMEAVRNGICQVVFRHFPLNRSCNPSLKKDLHPAACDAAKAASAAHQQGKFWLYHDALFTGQAGTDDQYFLELAKNTGLNLESFNAYRKSAAAESEILQDIAAAKALGVQATPSIYVNGRLVTDLRPGILSFLVSQAAKADTVGDQ